MKVAIIHDVYIEQGGAERVLNALLRLYPSADVYIPLLNKPGRDYLATLTNGQIISSFMNRIPFIHSASILLKPLLYWYWEYLDLRQYQLVISSSHSFSSKSVITSANCFHISYIHTPPRYLYAEFNETRILQKPIVRGLLTPLLTWLRNQDFLGAQRPDILIANSKTVQDRISKYYRRPSQIIFPPVTIPDSISKAAGRYFVTYSRLAKQKGTELAIQACNQLELPLVVIGQGSQESYLKSISGPTIVFVGFLTDQEVSSVFSKARALIYCSIEEDFGMAPVEAMAHGVPVIAYRSGGVTETVLEGKTGEFFDEYSVQALSQLLAHFKQKRYSAQACRAQATLFSEQTFKNAFQRVITKGLSKQ